MKGLIDLDGNPLGNGWDSSERRSGTELIPYDDQEFISTRGMYPTKMIFFVTGCYQDVVRRSFMTDINDDRANRLHDIVEQHQGTSMDLIGLSSIANEIIRPTSTIDREINIVNGWAEPRCRFFMEFVKPNGYTDEDGLGSYTTYAYTGFTDYVGVSEEGHIDPDMELHVTAVSVATHESRGYGRKRTRVVSDRNIIVNSHYYSDSQKNVARRNDRGISEYVMDPGNIVLMKHSIDTFNDTSIYGTKLHPSSARASRTIKGVNRSYNIPSHYLSRLINVRADVNRSADIYDDDDVFGMDGARQRTTRMRNILQMKPMDDDPLTSLYQEDGFTTTATLYFHQLEEYFPNIKGHDVLKIIFPAELRRGRSDTLHGRLRDIGQDTYESDDWKSANSATVAATMIAQQLPNLMISEFIQSIHFSVHNAPNSILGENYAWIIGDDRRSSRDNRSAVMFLTDLPNDYQRQRVHALKTKIEEVLLNVITMDNVIDIDLMVDADMLSDITIYISIDGGQEYKFVMPTFADSMATSLLTTDMDHYNHFSEDLVGLVEDVVRS